MRVAVDDVRIQLRGGEGLFGAFPPVVAVFADSLCVQSLGDRFADHHPRVEAGERILENKLKVAALGPHPVSVERS